MDKELLFKVLMGIGGHEYVIYTNGEIEGFGEGAFVVNCYDQLLALDRVQRSGANGISSSDAATRSGRRDDLAGASHSTPE